MFVSHVIVYWCDGINVLFLLPIGFDVLLEEVEDLKLDTPDAAEVSDTPCIV